jgi:hypothetical protein
MYGCTNCEGHWTKKLITLQEIVLMYLYYYKLVSLTDLKNQNVNIVDDT